MKTALLMGLMTSKCLLMLNKSTTSTTKSLVLFTSFKIFYLNLEMGIKNQQQNFIHLL